MIIGRQFVEDQYEEKLYSTGNDEFDEMLEKAFCEGYEYAQKEFGNPANKAAKRTFEMMQGLKNTNKFSNIHSSKTSSVKGITDELIRTGRKGSGSQSVSRVLNPQAGMYTKDVNQASTLMGKSAAFDQDFGRKYLDKKYLPTSKNDVGYSRIGNVNDRINLRSDFAGGRQDVNSTVRKGGASLKKIKQTNLHAYDHGF